MKDEALKLALEALETPHPGIRTSFTDSIKYREQCKEAITAIKQARSQPAPTVQEPVAWRDAIAVSLLREGINKHRARKLADHFIGLTTPPEQPATEDSSATQPAQRQSARSAWVGLTDEEVMQTMNGDWTSQFYFARAIEAKLRSKNNG
jgi:hypothetical protein